MDYDKYRTNCIERAGNNQFKCEISKIFIPVHRVSTWNFAHIRSKNKLKNGWEKENLFLFVCDKLHHYQHTLASNLIKYESVQYYLEHYDNIGQGNFYAKFIEEKYPEWMEYI